MLPPNRKLVVWTAALMAAGVAVALFAGSVPQKDSAAQNAGGPATVEVRSGTIVRTVRVAGSTAAAEATVLRAPYLRGSRSRGGAGDWNLELTQMIQPGAHVREGETVAVFDSESMRNRLDNDEADVAEAQGVVNKLRADQAAALEAHMQKIRVASAAVDSAILDLKTAKVRSQIDAQKFALTLEEARATLEALNAETTQLRASQAAALRSAELEFDRATVEARRAKANLDRLTVKAPMAGLVVAEQIYRFGQFGEIRQGDQLRSGQPYIRIADLSRMIVEATVNQVDAAELRIGQPVQVRFDAYPDLSLTGRVTGVGAMARASGSRATFVAEVPLMIALDEKDPRVIPGLTVSGDVKVATSENTAILSQSAISYQDGQPYAFVWTPTGWERRRLELDLSDNLNVAVQSGVQPGESVALTPPASWRDARSAPTTSVSPRGKAPSGV